MNKFGNCPLCGKQVKPTNLRKIVRQNQLCGFLMALDGIAITWGALIQNLRCELGLTDEQVQKIIRVGDRYWEMVGEFKNEGMAPSEAFMQYQEKCLWQIKRPYNPITARVNVRCVYYMATRRKVDLANLIEATCDILVKAKVLADDNSQIVAAHDGSRVDYDKKNPRAEIWIEEME